MLPRLKSKEPGMEKIINAKSAVLLCTTWGCKSIWYSTTSYQTFHQCMCYRSVCMWMYSEAMQVLIVWEIQSSSSPVPEIRDFTVGPRLHHHHHCRKVNIWTPGLSKKLRLSGGVNVYCLFLNCWALKFQLFIVIN